MGLFYYQMLMELMRVMLSFPIYAIHPLLGNDFIFEQSYHFLTP